MGTGTPLKQALPPFSSRFTPSLPELLAELDCSLALTTYQAGKVVLVSSDGERLIQLPRSFDTPMGLALSGDQMAVATRHGVTMLANDARLGASYPRKPGYYDSLFLPRSVHYCGQLNIHDIGFGRDGLVGVNTLFSCLFRLDARHSFVPVWQPPFITKLAPEDRCHLNGMALVDGAPRYVTAHGATDTPQGWRDAKLNGGVLVDVETNAIIARDLPMPHSPRVYNGSLYVLLSASGELARVDTETGTWETVTRMPAFVRGLARIGDHVFIGCSLLRKTHTFGDLPLAREQKIFCGVLAVHLPTGAVVGQLEYLNSCEEIYDVQVLPGLRRPGILGTLNDVHLRGLSLPETTYWGSADEPREPAGPPGPDTEAT
ncbi:MAG: TIGR03032 family protein [Candidatus Hydrogenedentes bacterium]|nr:TIGR03032 family protein [Candidatus Hydrogenedentota bacterium]